MVSSCSLALCVRAVWSSRSCKYFSSHDKPSILGHAMDLLILHPPPSGPRWSLTLPSEPVEIEVKSRNMFTLITSFGTLEGDAKVQPSFAKKRDKDRPNGRWKLQPVKASIIHGLRCRGLEDYHPERFDFGGKDDGWATNRKSRYECILTKWDTNTRNFKRIRSKPTSLVSSSTLICGRNTYHPFLKEEHGNNKTPPCALRPSAVDPFARKKIGFNMSMVRLSAKGSIWNLSPAARFQRRTPSRFGSLGRATLQSQA